MEDGFTHKFCGRPEKIDELLNKQSGAPVVEKKQRTPVTILFSDIKGSTAYFEKRGDLEGLAMVQRHNDLLFPCVEAGGGRIVKTIGDAIMALFENPIGAVNAAVEMQRVLEKDCRGRPVNDQIHIRIGVHTGLGLLQDNDVFGDVVNAAARVQGQAEPGQILITDSLLPAAETAGMQVGKLGRARMKGKDEPIDIFAVGWSPRATQQLIDDLQAKLDEKEKERKQSQETLEEEFDSARQSWREERRRLNSEIERLEEGAVDAMETARGQVAEELQKQGKVKQEAADTAREQAEEDLRSTHERFEAERVMLKAQISGLEGRLVESMEQANNPTRTATLVREQVQIRLEKAREEWRVQADAEKKRLEDRIEQARNTGPKDPMAEARRMMMERMKAKQEGREPGTPGAELKAEKDRLQKERDELQVRINVLEKEVQNTAETVRGEVYDELRHRYDQKLEHSDRVKKQLEQELASLTSHLDGERESLATRIKQLEDDVVAAEKAARVQATAEVKTEFELKLEEAERLRLRLDRRHRQSEEEWQVERERFEKQARELEARVKQAREAGFKRSSDPTIEELHRLRHQMEQEFEEKSAVWEEEKSRLTEKIARLESF